MTSKFVIFNTVNLKGLKKLALFGSASRKSILIGYVWKRWNSYSLWVKINRSAQYIFLASQWGMTSRTKLTEYMHHLHIDIKRPAKYHEILCINVWAIMFKTVLAEAVCQGQNQYIPRRIWGYKKFHVNVVIQYAFEYQTTMVIALNNIF